jgi:hypothetical protein
MGFFKQEERKRADFFPDESSPPFKKELFGRRLVGKEIVI